MRRWPIWWTSRLESTEHNRSLLRSLATAEFVGVRYISKGLDTQEALERLADASDCAASVGVRVSLDLPGRRPQLVAFPNPVHIVEGRMWKLVEPMQVEDEVGLLKVKDLGILASLEPETVLTACEGAVRLRIIGAAKDGVGIDVRAESDVTVSGVRSISTSRTSLLSTELSVADREMAKRLGGDATEAVTVWVSNATERTLNEIETASQLTRDRIVPKLERRVDDGELRRILSNSCELVIGRNDLLSTAGLPYAATTEADIAQSATEEGVGLILGSGFDGALMGNAPSLADRYSLSYVWQYLEAGAQILLTDGCRSSEPKDVVARLSEYGVPRMD